MREIDLELSRTKKIVFTSVKRDSVTIFLTIILLLLVCVVTEYADMVAA